MKRTLRLIFGIAVAIVLPLSLYFLTKNKLKDTGIKIPKYYRVESVNKTTKGDDVTVDTVFHKINGIRLTNQLGAPIDLLKDAKGKVLVIDFIFTSCNSICPIMTRHMSVLQQSYLKKNPDMVQFVSISVDPQRDSVSVLRAYADSYKADHDMWWFLTGNKDSIFNFAQNELGLSLQDGDVVNDVIHSNKIILVDSSRYIRGYYNGLDTFALRDVLDDIALLHLQKKRKK